MTEDEKTRSAGVRQEDRLLGLNSQELVRATKASREIQSTYRVLAKEWSLIARFDEADHARKRFQDKYEGRVLEDDWIIEPPNDFSTKYTLYVRLWTVAAEFKTQELAEAWAAESEKSGVEMEVVARNSRREHTLNQFGILKIA